MSWDNHPWLEVLFQVKMGFRKNGTSVITVVIRVKWSKGNSAPYLAGIEHSMNFHPAALIVLGRSKVRSETGWSLAPQQNALPSIGACSTLALRPGDWKDAPSARHFSR